MKTQKCLQARSRAPHHGHHEVHGDLTETYCPGEPSLVERVYKALDRPYKFSMLVSDGHLADMLDERLASLYKQLRTRDRKITRLTKEKQDLITALGLHLGKSSKMDLEDISAAYERAEIMVLGDAEHRRRTGRSILR